MYQTQIPAVMQAVLRALQTGMTQAEFDKKVQEGREAHRAAREQGQGGGK